MDPLRLHLFLLMAVHNAWLSTALAHQVFLTALRQWDQGAAFVGRVVKYDTKDSHLLLLGQQ